MGSGSEDVLVEPNWFDLDGDNGLPSSDVDVEFLTALRSRAAARTWNCDPESTFGFHTYENREYVLMMGLAVADDETNTGLMTFGLVFDGKRIYGDEVHDQTHEFIKRTEAAVDFSGPLKRLIERAAEWFEWLLTWPIERREWYDGDTQIYHEWVLQRTGRKLWINAPRPPAGPPDKVSLVHGVPRAEP